MVFKRFSGYVENIRLTADEVDAIKESFKAIFPKSDKLWIFGSRVDMNAKGGDIDLYIECASKDAGEIVRMEREFAYQLEVKLGEQKIDIVINMVSDFHLPIYDVARRDGVRLV